MSKQAENLKDVKCERCKRVIGKRRGALFVYQNLQIIFKKTSPIYCPFSDCGRKIEFKVNKEQAQGKMMLKMA